jgi:hypothetical protein
MIVRVTDRHLACQRMHVRMQARRGKTAGGLTACVCVCVRVHVLGLPLPARV